MSQTSEDLKATVDALDEHGWCQGPPMQRQLDGVKGVCVMEAIAVAVTGDATHWGDMSIILPPDMRHRVRAANRAVHAARAASGIKSYDHHEASNWMWNDDARTTVEEVKLVLKRAIEAEEAKA